MAAGVRSHATTPPVDRHDGRDRRVRRLRRRLGVGRPGGRDGRRRPPGSRESGRAGRAAAALGWAGDAAPARRSRTDRRRRVPALGARDGGADRLGDAAHRLDRAAIGRGRVPRWLAESLGVSLAAQAATLPVVLVAFGRLAVLSPLVNLAVVPLVAPAMAAGAGRDGRRRRSRSRARPRSSARSWRCPAGSPCGSWSRSSRRRRRLPFASVTLPPPMAGPRWRVAAVGRPRRRWSPVATEARRHGRRRERRPTPRRRQPPADGGTRARSRGRTRPVALAGRRRSWSRAPSWSSRPPASPASPSSTSARVTRSSSKARAAAGC